MQKTSASHSLSCLELESICRRSAGDQVRADDASAGGNSGRGAGRLIMNVTDVSSLIEPCRRSAGDQVRADDGGAGRHGGGGAGGDGGGAHTPLQ